MNYSTLTSNHCQISSGAVNLLLLSCEWLHYVEANSSNIHSDVILMLLEGICSLSRTKVHFSQLSKTLEATDKHLSEKFIKRVQVAERDVCYFIQLFDHCKKYCDKIGKKHGCLDFDLKGSLISIFIERCLQEYCRLTFAQICRLHSMWCSGLPQDNITKNCANTTAKNSSDNSNNFFNLLKVEMCARYPCDSKQAMEDSDELMGIDVRVLQLARLHESFGHKEEGLFALHQCIRLAQQSENHQLLEYALGWLNKLQFMSTEEAKETIDVFISHSKKLGLQGLHSWGQMRAADISLMNSETAKKVLRKLLYHKLDYVPSSDTSTVQPQQRLLLLAKQGMVLDHYGHKFSSLLYFQIVCHMLSVNSLRSDVADLFQVAVCGISKYLHRTNQQNSFKMLESAKDAVHQAATSPKILFQCMQEISIDNALQMQNFAKAKTHIRKLSTFSFTSSQLWNACLLKNVGNYKESLKILQNLLGMKRVVGNEEAYQDCFVLLAEIYSELGMREQALAHIETALKYCQDHNSPNHSRKILLAQLQLQLGTGNCSTVIKGEYLLWLFCQQAKLNERKKNTL